jgi:integrase
LGVIDIGKLTIFMKLRKFHMLNTDGKREWPKKRKKGECGRYWVTRAEVDRLMAAAAKLGRNGHRDSTMILTGYRHGLRVCELVALDWSDVNFEARTVYVRRRKGSKSGEHDLQADEIKALRKIGRQASGPVFTSESGLPMTTSGFFKIIARAGVAAKIGLPIHPHMLRHGFGYYLANRNPPLGELEIMELMGHRNIQHTLEYTKLNPNRLRKFSLWDEGKSK